MQIIALVFEDTISFGNIISILAFLGLALIAFVTLRERSISNTLMVTQLKARLDGCSLEQMKERVDTMWIFQLRRGITELEIKKLGKANSPIKLSPKAKEIIAPFVPRLKKFYQEINGDELGIVDLAVKLELQFGEVLVKEICPRIGITEGACLILAIAELRPISDEVLNDSINRNSGKIIQSLGIRGIPTPTPIRRALLKHRLL